jgi:hypothetical protein
VKAKNIGEPSEPPVQEWDDAAAIVAADYAPGPDKAGPNRFTTWLTTINPDGSPHVTPVGALWVDDTFWFQTGETTRKAKNIARDPRCAISISVNEMDLTFDGAAAKVTDTADVARLAAEWAKGGWPCEVDSSGVGITAPFNAPGVGPAPWTVYRIAPRAATSVKSNEPGGTTRWIF